MIRPAEMRDLQAITAIYDRIFDLEDRGEACTGWVRGIYPGEQTARAAIEAGDMFVMTDETGAVAASGRINQEQMPAYAEVDWREDAPAARVLVLHTLTVDPQRSGRGWGTRFIRAYEAMAWERGCPFLRIDTNEINLPARRLYHRLGYEERGIIPTVFNGIPGVGLVCLEKRLTGPQAE